MTTIDSTPNTVADEAPSHDLIDNASEAYGLTLETLERARALAGRIQCEIADDEQALTVERHATEEGPLYDLAVQLRPVLSLLATLELVLRKGIGEDATESVRQERKVEMRMAVAS
jgi:hypothetical protein